MHDEHMDGGAARASNIRRTELLAALSVAIDLGMGQPAEHMLRSALVAARLADQLNLTHDERDTAFHLSLIMWIGCHADSHEYVQWFGDDIEVKKQAYLYDWAGLPYMRFLMGNVAYGAPLPDRLKLIARLMRDPRGQLGDLIHSHCVSASLLATEIGLSPLVEQALRTTFERYDGQGAPGRLRGEQIPIAMRVAQFADFVEVHHRTYGIEGAEQLARSRRGGQFDPVVVDAFLEKPVQFLVEEASPWDAVMDAAPDRSQPMSEADLDRVLVAVGDFVDLKCPFTLGHSRAVASLAASAAKSLGLDSEVVASVRRAGHVHDIGRIGISNRVWEHPGSLSAEQWERVRLHPYLTGRILGRVPGLAEVARIAANHHEQPDGGGYPRGIAASQLPMPDLVLAAAVAYESALEPRPYRLPEDPGAAADRLRERAKAGALDVEAVNAVLAVAGHLRIASPKRSDRLTPREVEILVQVAQGESNREIAARFTLSEKTVRNHVERIYTKVGVTNRIGASLYALDKGLIARGS